MDLVHQHVTHTSLGPGVITAQTEDIITVRFSSRECRFWCSHPETFRGVLTFDDPGVQAAVLLDAEAAKIAAAKERRAAEEKRRAEAAARAEELERSKAKPKRRRAGRPRAAAPSAPEHTPRIPGKPMTFYVFQGGSFEADSTGGYIWATKQNSNGESFFYWDNMLLVKKGDIVLHGCSGCVVAISVALSDCYDCRRPKEREYNGAKNNDGRRVDLQYTLLEYPVRTADFTEDILRYCNVRYSPFDKTGNGNMGYLYELNRSLARVFLRAAIHRNPDLSRLDYVRELLAEEEE